MPQLFDISKVTVGPKNLEAVVSVAPNAPLRTSDDPEGTELVLQIMPGLADHLCLGDASSSFGEVVGDTELAHLLEHVTVELLAQTNAAGDVTAGQTAELGERSYKITLACPDDVLVAGALSSAAWILQWAYSGGGEPEPDVPAIASGLVGLVASLGEPGAEQGGEVEVAPALEEELGFDAAGDEGFEADGFAPDEGFDSAPVDDLEPAAVPEEPAQGEPAPATELLDESVADEPTEPEPEAQDDDPWQMKGVPRPRLVR